MARRGGYLPQPPSIPGRRSTPTLCWVCAVEALLRVAALAHKVAPGAPNLGLRLRFPCHRAMPHREGGRRYLWSSDEGSHPPPTWIGIAHRSDVDIPLQKACEGT
jgi:hypothetical protein